jgi:hypothetical protein
MSDSDRRPSRRDFLRSSAAVALGAPVLAAAPPWTQPLLLPRGVAGPPRPLPGRTQHVVVVAFAGGVRSKDVLDVPANSPNLHRIAKNGVVLPNVRASNGGHYGAALSIFTGNTESLGIRDENRGLNPTVFEYLRKDGGFAASDLWVSTANGAQARLFAFSAHPDYGEHYGATLLDGEGIFNVEFQKVLETFGRPRVDGEKESRLLDGLAGALDPAALQSLQRGAAPDPAQVRRIEKFILDELAGNTTRVTGPGAPDAKAIRVGLNILRTFRPRLLAITLQSADVAHGSYNSYLEVIRRNDEELGKLWDAVQQDDELKDKTAVLVLPEFGRDKDLNQRNGLDHGDDSDCLRKVFLIAAGPEFKRDKTLRTEISTHDVCPTVLSLFGRPQQKLVGGKPISDLFA